MAPTMRSAAKFIEKTVDAVPGLIYTAPSGVGASSLADELMLLGPKYANGLVVTQAVPDPAGYSSGVLEYRTALKKYFPDEAPNTISFETYLETLILMEGFRRAGPQFDTEKLVDALESIKGFDLSIGAPAGFSRSDHQAIHKVWGTMLDSKGVYQPIEME